MIRRRRRGRLRRKRGRGVFFGPRPAAPRSATWHIGRVRQEEAWLDAGYGGRLLEDPASATIVQNALLHFDGARYSLHAWCVMPHHVHVLLTPGSGVSLSALMHAWKPYTALAINRRNGRGGPLWEEEYFDRLIRDGRHFATALAYFENNPVKAGLCVTAADWRFSSAAFSRAGGPRSQAPSA